MDPGWKLWEEMAGVGEFRGYRILQAELGGRPDIRGSHEMSKDKMLLRSEGQ